MTGTAPIHAFIDPAPAPRERLRGKILVVDDEPAVRRFIELGLRSGGYEDLIFCSSGTGVPLLALNERPQLIIMDVMMPGGNGMRALRQLKQSVGTVGIPIILTSGFHVLTLEECAQNRVDSLLSKPFTVAQLLKEVTRLIPA